MEALVRSKFRQDRLSTPATQEKPELTLEPRHTELDGMCDTCCVSILRWLVLHELCCVLTHHFA